MARRRRCWLACGLWPAVPAGAETVALIGSLGSGQQLLAEETVASFVVHAGDEESVDAPGSGGILKYRSGAVASNGAIYACPFHASAVLKVDPANDVISVFGDAGTGSFKWAHAVVAANDNVYCIPDSAAAVLEIDTAADTVSFLGTGDIDSGSYKWKHAVVAASGAIYGIPFYASTVLKVDPLSGAVTQILASSSATSLGTDPSKWRYGVRASSGIIYGIPCSADSVLRIDPASDSVSTLGDVSGAGAGCKWAYGVEAQNGAIYAAPYSASAVLKIDTNTEAVTLLDSFTNTGLHQWQLSIVSSTGVIYALPDKAESVLRIAPAENGSVDNVSTMGSFEGTHYKYRDGAAVDSGAIYGIPYQAGGVLKIDPENDTVEALADFGSDRIPKWRSAVVAPNGAIYALPSSAGSVLKVDPEDLEDTPPDGWNTSAPTTASAGVVGVAGALVIAFTVLCGLALIVRKRLQGKRSRAGVQQEPAQPAAKGCSNNSASGSLAPSPAAGHPESPAPTAAPPGRGGPAAAPSPAAGHPQAPIAAPLETLPQDVVLPTRRLSGSDAHWAPSPAVTERTLHALQAWEPVRSSQALRASGLATEGPEAAGRRGGLERALRPPFEPTFQATAGPRPQR